MNKKRKIISEFSKIATDAFGTFSGIKKEIETIIKLRIEKVINKSDLIKRDEFDTLKIMVQRLSKRNKEIEKVLKRSKTVRKTNKKLGKKNKKT